MKIKDILSCTPKVLSQDQREYYFENGCLLLENFITGARLKKLQDITQDFIEKSRACNASNDMFDLEPDHTSEHPRVRRAGRQRTQCCSHAPGPCE